LLTTAIVPYIAQLQEQAARNVSAAKALCQKMAPVATIQPDTRPTTQPLAAL
jgi:hypothetical protein